MVRASGLSSDPSRTFPFRLCASSSWIIAETAETTLLLLGEALKAGAFPKLEELRFSFQSPHQILWEAVEAGGCPEVRLLILFTVLLDSASSTALASAVASGSLSKLQDFQFCGWGRDDEDTSLVEVLIAVASSCPYLR